MCTSDFTGEVPRSKGLKIVTKFVSSAKNFLAACPWSLREDGSVDHSRSGVMMHSQGWHPDQLFDQQYKCSLMHPGLSLTCNDKYSAGAGAMQCQVPQQAGGRCRGLTVGQTIDHQGQPSTTNNHSRGYKRLDLKEINHEEQP